MTTIPSEPITLKCNRKSGGERTMECPIEVRSTVEKDRSAPLPVTMAAELFIPPYNSHSSSNGARRDDGTVIPIIPAASPKK